MKITKVPKSKWNFLDEITHCWYGSAEILRITGSAHLSNKKKKRISSQNQINILFFYERLNRGDHLRRRNVSYAKQLRSDKNLISHQLHHKDSLEKEITPRRLLIDNEGYYRNLTSQCQEQLRSIVVNGTATDPRKHVRERERERDLKGPKVGEPEIESLPQWVWLLLV